MYLKKLFRIILFAILFFPCISQAQENNRKQVIIDDDVKNLDSLKKYSEFIKIDTVEDKPNMAALYSAVLPGLGQVYNNKPWKLPIIYGGFVFFGYILKYNHEAYVESKRALFAEEDGDPRTSPEPPLDNVSLDILERRNDFYRRNRDFVIILTAAWYLLNVVDAHVDAHLNEFTITDDLSLNITPSVQRFYTYNNYGVSITLNF